MAGKKALKSDLKVLRAKLDKARARGDRWKARARRAEQDAVELRADLKKVKKRAPEPPPAPADAAQDAAPAAAPERPQPDASWTVVRLRAEAKSRGLTGVTTKSKDQLLTLLRAE